MLKIGIIGLGGISKKHINEINNCDKGEIVAIGLHGEELETTIAEVFADK